VDGASVTPSGKSPPASANSRTLLQAIIKRSKSRAFWHSLKLILFAEVVTLVVTWLLLDANTNRWIQQKRDQTANLSQLAAQNSDWSRIDEIKQGKNSALFQSYQTRLGSFNQRYFPRDEGSIYIEIVKAGEAYTIATNDKIALDDDGKANQWEIDAYRTGKTTSSPVPIVDDSGTYLAAFTPVIKNGRVIGLVAAEYDEAPLSDFRAIVRSAFLFSAIPAVVLSLIMAYGLASFARPTEVLREIEEIAQRTRDDEHDPRWDMLTDQEKRIANFLSRGVTSTKEIASEMNLKESSVYTYIKRIKQRTGLEREQLAVLAAGLRNASFPPAGT